MDLTLTYWATATVLVHSLAVWAARTFAAGGPPGLSLRHRLARWRWAGPALREAGRFAFYLGVPYLALVQGVVSPRTLGLSAAPPAAAGVLTGPAALLGGLLALDWARSLGVGGLLAAGAFAALALIWWRYQQIVGHLPTRSGRFQPAEKPVDSPPAARWPLSGMIAALQQPWGWARLLLEAVYLETHWAFYRAWTLDLLRDDPAGSVMGACLGLVLVGLEWYGDVGLRVRLRTQAGVEEWVFVASLAVVSTFIFIFVSNLWVLFAAHWLISWGLLAFLAWLRQRAAVRAAPARARGI